MTSSSRSRVLERKVRLDGTSEDFECEALLVEPGKRAVLRYVLQRGWDVAGVLEVPKGAVTISHYWSDRAYNVYHWLVEGRTLAYYCNVVGATTIAPDRVEYLDLSVDVLIDPQGNARVLDEDDLPPDLDPAHRRTIARAIDELTGQSRRIASEVADASARAAG